jgi:hypothetical protein
MLWTLKLVPFGELESSEMAKPSWLHLGFFVEDSVGEFKCPPTARAGPEVEKFKQVVEQVLGPLPNREATRNGISRNEEGIVTVELWGLDGQVTLAATLLELQQLSGCQIVKQWGKVHTYFVHAKCLESELRYYVEEFRDVVKAWHQANLSQDCPSRDLKSTQ